MGRFVTHHSSFRNGHVRILVVMQFAIYAMNFQSVRKVYITKPEVHVNCKYMRHCFSHRLIFVIGFLCSGMIGALLFFARTLQLAGSLMRQDLLNAGPLTLLDFNLKSLCNLQQLGVARILFKKIAFNIFFYGAIAV